MAGWKGRSEEVQELKKLYFEGQSKYCHNQNET